MRIRTRLLVLALSILLPAFAAAGLAVWYVYAEQQAAQAKSLAEATRAFAMLVDTELQSTESQLISLASSPELERGHLADFAEHAKRVAPPPDTVVVLSTPEGQQILNTRAAPGAVLPRTNPGLLALRQQSANTSVVSNLFTGGVAQRLDIAVDIPVRFDGKVRYWLAMGRPASSLQALLAKQGLPAGWLATIVDRNDHVVARSRNPERFVGKRANDSLLRRVLAREASGLNFGVTLDGRPVAAFFSRAPKSEWTVVLAIPLTEMRAPAMHAAVLLAVVLFLLLGVAVVAAGWYGRKTAQPIERLRQAAERLGRGELVQPEPTGLVETDLVVAALSDASRQVRDSKAHLEHRVAEAVAATERAQRSLLQGQKLEALGRLTGGIAHDFNNILQTLATALQLIRRSPDRAQVQVLASTCEKAISRATALTAQMRSFGRIQDVRLETVALPDAVSTVLPLLSNTLPSNIELHTRLGDGLWPVTLDRLQFELALLNVVINARDALPHGGRITLDVGNVHLDPAPAGLPPGDYLQLTVTDNGSGMAPDVLAHALDPFYTTKPVDQGSGLGLPQAYGFASQAGGTLLLASQLGEGTTVTLYLPRAQAQVAQAGARTDGGAAGGRGSGTILFVEDDVLVREAVVPALREAGFHVIEAATGDAAVAILDSGQPVQVVFSDVVMPGGISGVDLARVVTARFPRTHVVLATGHADMPIDLPDVQLLGKPYDLTSVIRVLAQSAATPAPIAGAPEHR